MRSVNTLYGICVFQDATQDWSPGAGDAATLEAQRRGKKSKEDKEREKREKEEEKRRKKEEEKERKRLEKERKQGKGAEDRTDKMVRFDQLSYFHELYKQYGL